MAGKIIRVVYDPKIESADSLSKFLGIVLEKAHYPIQDIKFVKQEDYIQEIDKGLRQGNYTICLNKTYSIVSLKLSSVYKEPTYKFFSRYYSNVEGQVIIVGLQVDISEIFGDDNQKKASWAKLLTFKKDFDTCSEGSAETLISEESTEVVEKVQTVVAPPAPLPTEEAPTPEVIPEVIEDAPVTKKTTRKTPVKKSTPTAVEPPSQGIKDLGTPSHSYEDLLAFYNAWVTLNTLATKLATGSKP